MLWFYKKATQAAKPLLKRILAARLRRGKEDPERIGERYGEASQPRPEGKLAWIHVASVGEAQSMLVLIDALLAANANLKILVTSGTVTSARLMQSRLPERAIHQFSPVDHPDWVRRFLDHWRPDLVLWAESELWPNMLMQISKRNIPAALVNARLSYRSFKRWSKIKPVAEKLLETFHVILTQTEIDADYFKRLGGRSVAVTDNIKYSAAPLPVHDQDAKNLQNSLQDRPHWVYASTHHGEEDLACDAHKELMAQFPNLLTIIVPRHPDRRYDISTVCTAHGLHVKLRGQGKDLPQPSDQIYIADTLGELGLFYKISPIACIGRSFSHDGGGGHNPLEAAIWGCAVISGPNIQNLQEIFTDMATAGAVRILKDKADLTQTLAGYFANPSLLKAAQDKALSFSQRKSSVIVTVLRELEPVLIRAGFPAAIDTSEKRA